MEEVTESHIQGKVSLQYYNSAAQRNKLLPQHQDNS